MNPIKKNNTFDIYIPLLGVDNEHCGHIVNQSLANIEGLNKYFVDINNQQLKLESNDLIKVIPIIIDKIKALGYNVASTKKTLNVLNMHCASCANTSENILKQQLGVISASVNYANESATIEYLPSIIKLQQLKEALQKVGYDLIIENEGELDDEDEDILDHIHQNNFKILKRNFTFSLLLSIPLVILGMTPTFMHLSWAHYLMWILSTPVVFYFDRQFFIGAYKQARNKSSNMDTLIAISTGTAYLFSVFNIIYPSYWTSKGLEAHVYFETSAVVITFILLGKILEEKAKRSTSSAIKKLIGLQPKTVTLLNSDGSQKEISIKDIEPEMILLVKPGDKIAVDGSVVAGSSFVDESMINGEPIAVEKNIGSSLFAGTINQKGSLQIKAEKVGKDTLLSQIIQTIKDAQASKSPVQKTVDKISGIFVPIVFTIAITSLLIWTILGGSQGFIYGLQCFVSILVIACPCALGLATPTAIMVGIGKAAKKGILVKDAESLEIVKKINSIVLDKTGTITEGKPVVNAQYWINENIDYKNILYSIEKSSDHPLAEALVKHLDQEKPIFLSKIQIHNVVGKGVISSYEQKKYWVGNPSFIKEQNILLPEKVIKWINKYETQAHTVILFADQIQLLAIFALSDPIKKTSKNAIQQLKRLNIEVSLLTGDQLHAAKYVAKEVGIDSYKASVSPQEKTNYIKKLQQSSHKLVAMVGDGINDSAAMAQADIGIAMGKGSDIAMDVAKITLISGDLHKLIDLIKLSKQTASTLNQNLFWAFIYNLIGIPIAAGILYYINGFLLNPMFAGAAMALSSVSVVFNSLLLKWKK